LLWFIAVGLIGISGIAYAASGTPHWVHYRLLQNNPNLPKKVVVLPVNVEVLEVTAGGVKEEVPEWSAEASRSVVQAISNHIKTSKNLQQVPAPDLSSQQGGNVDEHLALYKLVVNTSTSLDFGWKHKIRRFDYGIGPGLDSLRQKTGADAAIMVYGRDYVSTAGRKARAVAGNIPIVSAFTGPPPELGHSFIHLGLVDLKTGDLLWMNSEFRKGTTNLREYADASKMIKNIFRWYPGIDQYRRAYVR
jgi:hypothetical protein